VRAARVLKRYSLSNPFEPPPSRISFHYPDVTPPMDVILGAHNNQIKLHGGHPPGVLELNDVFLINGDGHDCLYDASGRRIEQSCVRRGANGREFILSEIEVIDLPAEYDTLAEPVLYLSSLNEHWGHFLTETISRLWARYEYPELRGMTALYRGYFPGALDDYPYISDFFRALSGAPLRMASVTRPTKINKCFVPAASFSNRNEAYTSHLLSVHDVARSILGDVVPKANDRPVYLSRSRLKGVDRSVVNEAELEAELVDRGFDLVYPETMTLAAQIKLFNSRAIIVGCCGSAFHGMMFGMNRPRVSTYTLCYKWVNENYTLSDLVAGHRSHYLCVLERANSADVGPPRRLRIDVAAALSQFAEFGIV
jgi:hypothetical protein